MNAVDNRAVTKDQYFIEAMQSECYRHKEWVLSVFSVVRKMPDMEQPYPYRIVHRPDSDALWFVDPTSGELTAIEGSNKKAPLFPSMGAISLDVKQLANVDRRVETTYGNAFLNAVMFVYPFGDKIPFMTGKLEAGKIENIITSRWREGLSTDFPDDKEGIYVDEYQKFADGVSSLAGYTQVNCPAASRETLTMSKAVIAERDRILAAPEEKAKLNNPVELANVEQRLTKMDRESHKGTDAEGFYIGKDKAYDITRKKTMIFFGAEAGFETDTTQINPVFKPLDEGLDLDALPNLIDNARSGSYNRGKMTALGGESVKYFYRIFQNSKIIMLDCGTSIGINWMVTKDNFKKFVGLYEALPVGTPSATVLEKTTGTITLDYAQSKVGSYMHVRSPMGCQAEAPSFCHHCSGDAMAANPTSLHTSIADVGSSFMLCFMKAMHGKALRTSRYKFSNAIR